MSFHDLKPLYQGDIVDYNIIARYRKENDIFTRKMINENRDFYQGTVVALGDAFEKKIERLKEKIQKIWDETKPKLDEKMKELAARGYSGFDLYDHPYSEHPVLMKVFYNISQELKVLDKYILRYEENTVSIIIAPHYVDQRTLKIIDKSVTYDLDKESRKEYKNFKRKTELKMAELEKLKKEVGEMTDRLNEVYCRFGTLVLEADSESPDVQQQEEPK